MASKYLQKYYVPPNFTEILSDLTREILRSQTDDVIQFCANYFDAKAKGKEYVEKHNDVYNYDTNKKQLQEIAEKSKNVVKISNQKIIDSNPVQKNTQDKQSQKDTIMEQKPVFSQKIENKNIIKNEQPVQQIQEQNQQEMEIQEQPDQKPHDTSGISHNSGVSHPEEKQVTKEFIGNLYNSAIDKAILNMDDYQQDNNEQQEEQPNIQQEQQILQKKETVKEEPVVLDGPIEEYEQAARFMQAKFKTKQMRKNK